MRGESRGISKMASLCTGCIAGVLFTLLGTAVLSSHHDSHGAMGIR